MRTPTMAKKPIWTHQLHQANKPRLLNQLLRLTKQPPKPTHRQKKVARHPMLSPRGMPVQQAGSSLRKTSRLSQAIAPTKTKRLSRRRKCYPHSVKSTQVKSQHRLLLLQLKINPLPLLSRPRSPLRFLSSTQSRKTSHPSSLKRRAKFTRRIHLQPKKRHQLLSQ